MTDIEIKFCPFCGHNTFSADFEKTFIRFECEECHKSFVVDENDPADDEYFKSGTRYPGQ